MIRRLPQLRPFVLFVLLFCSAIGSAQESDTLRVLFVGNSFTYFWNVPQLVQAMANEEKVPLLTRQSTAGGATWEEHWTGKKNLRTKEIIQKGNFDIVVLQNHSTSTINNLEAFNEYGKKFAQLIRESGGEPLLYMTWAYQSNPLMLPTIKKGYASLAKVLNVEFVPIGPLYARARLNRPDLDLFHDDKHQSMNGSYLIALAFYKQLADKSVLEVPFRLTATDADGEKTYLSIINAADAQFIKELVETH